ncbi:MAG: cupredoxin domain-containing protein [Chloroflexi bacterium]|nr:cupredoxin domain-containing protein [Chloroflexota bacterium]
MALVAGTGFVAFGTLHWPLARPRLGKDGVQEVEIVIQGGYSPDRVQVRRGAPVRIIFNRREGGECTQWVIFPGLDIVCWLPAFRKTTVEVEPPAPGEFEFRCKFGVCRGRLIVMA